MNTAQMTVFAALLCGLLFLIGWRWMRAEEGHGLLPFSEDTGYGIVSVFLTALSMLCFAASAIYLAQAILISERMK